MCHFYPMIISAENKNENKYEMNNFYNFINYMHIMKKKIL